MSRIGNKPIPVPAGVTVDVNSENLVTVKGPKGELVKKMHPEVKIIVDGAEVRIERLSEDNLHKSLHGLTRTLVNNMVVGVSEGFSKELEINGVGYRAVKQGKKVVLTLGYSHPVEFEEIEGITLEVPSQTQIIVKGIDKELVGEIAANIRKTRKPEPYKGKGIKYADERIRRKEGKTGGKK